MTDHDEHEVELDDDALALAAGGDLIPTSATDWNFHSIIPSPSGDSRMIAKTKLGTTDISGAENMIYSIPAISLVSNFSDHHLENVSQGVNLIGRTNVGNGGAV